MSASATTPELLPCPFCGAAPTTYPDDSYGLCGVLCKCEAEPFIQRPVGKLADAIAAWNRRAPSCGQGEVEPVAWGIDESWAAPPIWNLIGVFLREKDARKHIQGWNGPRQGRVIPLYRVTQASEPERPHHRMALCEASHLIMRVGHTYEFYPVEGCAECTRLAHEYDDEPGHLTTNADPNAVSATNGPQWSKPSPAELERLAETAAG